MKRLYLLAAACLILISCNNSPKVGAVEKQIETTSETEEPVSSPPVQKEFFGTESAYVKYRTLAAGQEMIREWWFDQHGKRQYEENYFFIMDKKTGSKSIVMDGFQYQWDLNSNTGTKRKFYQAVTDYEKISERDIKRYGIEKHAYEDVLGKRCLKITTEKPAKSTLWVWNNIPLKTEAVFSGNKVTVEAVELSTDQLDAKVFELPADITFLEGN